MTVLTSTQLYETLKKFITLPDRNVISATIHMFRDMPALLTCECYIEGAPEFITETKQYYLSDVAEKAE